MGPSLSLTALYLKGHCGLASLPCSEQCACATEQQARKGRGAGKPGIACSSEMPELISREGMKAEDGTHQRSRDFNGCIWAGQQEAD